MSAAGGFSRRPLPEPWEIEGSAAFLLALVAQDGSDRPDIEQAILDLGFLIARVRVDGKRGWTDFVKLIVYCRPERDKREETWTLAHELAHICQELERLPLEFHDELITDQIARAILMPERAFRRVVRRFGPYHIGVAQEYQHIPAIQRFARAAELGF